MLFSRLYGRYDVKMTSSSEWPIFPAAQVRWATVLFLWKKSKSSENLFFVLKILLLHDFNGIIPILQRKNEIFMKFIFSIENAHKLANSPSYLHLLNLLWGSFTLKLYECATSWWIVTL